MCVAAVALPLAAAVALEAVRCATCGMAVDLQARSTCRIGRDEKALVFCEVGDLLVHLNERPASPAAEVKDHRTGEWLPAEKAFYVRSEKAFRTPMGWSIVAFGSREEAAAFGEPMDLEAARRAVR